MPNVTDPNNNPIPILTKGDGAHSNIIYALSGTPGTLWDPNNPAGFGQMPAGGPYMPTDQIQLISDWISRLPGNGGGRQLILDRQNSRGPFSRRLAG